MILHHLHAVNYKNLAAADLTFSPRLNCLTGQNGMGKTNLLDAIYYLSFCKSAGGAPDACHVRHGEQFFLLQGEYEEESTGQRQEVTCSLQMGARKRLRLNGKDAGRVTEHVGRIPLILISPADQFLVSGGSEERRRFLDQVIAQYDARYLAAIVRYAASLKQRNALLKQDAAPDEQMMALYEEMLSADAEVIYAARAAFVADFTPYFTEIHAQLCGCPDEVATLSLRSHAERGALLPLLQQGREAERAVGHTLRGPHKDDLDLLLGGYPVRREASQGQTKTYFIAMKLAQYVFLRDRGAQRTPLLLLDDVFDKLDAQRVARIVAYVSTSGFGQTFITDTDRSRIDRILAAAPSDYRLFSVSEGEITEVDARAASPEHTAMLSE